MTRAFVFSLLLLTVHCRSPQSIVTEGVVDIGGGMALQIHCIGDGSPAVVFDAGLGGDSRSWSGLLPKVGSFTRACSYDRAGMGNSSQPAPRPHSNQMMARELYALLQRAGVPGPYVFVGHSMGGMNIRLLASEHLDDVAGMVLVDSVGADQPARVFSLMSEPEMADFRVHLSQLPEGLDYDTFAAGFAALQTTSRSIGNRPLVVLTHGVAPPATSPEQVRSEQEWQAMQTEMLRLSTNAVQVIAKSDHSIQKTAPRLVIESVRQVVDAARSPHPLDGTALAALALEPVAKVVIYKKGRASEESPDE